MVVVVALDEIGTKLTDDGIVEGSTGWRLAKGTTMEEQDQVVTIIESPGEIPDQDASGEPEHNFPGFQLRIRGNKFGYQTARAKAQEVFDSLNNAALSGFNYIYADSAPFYLGYDDNNRPELVVNFSSMQER